MAGAFQITPQELAALAKKVETAAAELETAIQQMNQKVDAIEGAWQGSARKAFDPLQEKALVSSNRVKEALRHIAGAMAKNAGRYDVTEQDITSSMSKIGGIF